MVFVKYFLFKLEATPGFEPGIRVLQTRALATWLCRHKMEQVTRIELVTKPWQGFILPLNYTCTKSFYNLHLSTIKFLNLNYKAQYHLHDNYYNSKKIRYCQGVNKKNNLVQILCKCYFCFLFILKQ